MHPNTKLSEYTRCQLMEEYGQGVSMKALAEKYRVSRTTCYRWRQRFRAEGAAGLHNRSSRPHRVRYRLSADQEEQLVQLRATTRHGPARLAQRLEVPQSTAYRCLRRRGMHRLPRPPRPPVVRYETKAPGELVHLDVLHLFALRGAKPAYQFTLVDGHTRMAYACIVPHRTTQAALEAVEQAKAAFGFPIRRVLTDNDVTFAWTPRPRWRSAPPDGVTRFTRTLRSWGIHHSLTRIRRPQTNGKVERFHRTVKEELYRVHPLFTSEQERQTALAGYLASYNHTRQHMALGGVTPVQRRDAFFLAHQVSTTS